MILQMLQDYAPVVQEASRNDVVIIAIVMGVLIPVAALLTFYITRKLIEKQLKENPPISEKQIRAMFLSMGRKPSEAQIRNVMNSVKGANKKGYNKRK